MKQVRIDKYTNSSQWVSMRLTHEQSKVSVSGKSKHPAQLKTILTKELIRKLQNYPQANID
jgi:hypothetical protein